MRTPIDPRYFFIKYSLEFFIVVLGISVSFWLSEWNEDRKRVLYNIEDTFDLLEDLRHDEERLEMIVKQINVGMIKTQRLLVNVELHRDNILSYRALSDSLVDIGYVYEYGTFFMNNSTYKSLLQNGRLHDFPSEIEKNIKDYYEYVSKRVEDNNRLVDDLAASYYNKHHPLCLRSQIKELPINQVEMFQLYQKEDMRENYTSLNFYKASMSLRSRINMHRAQVQKYINMRNNVDSLLREHVGLDTLKRMTSNQE
jgi:hypothetical protein